MKANAQNMRNKVNGKIIEGEQKDTKIQSLDK